MIDRTMSQRKTLSQLKQETQADQAARPTNQAIVTKVEGHGAAGAKKGPAPAVRARRLQPATLDKYMKVATEWLRNGCNATKAYMSVYPKSNPQTAAKMGWAVLNHPKIQKFLEASWHKATEENQVDAEYIYSELLNASRANPTDYLPDAGSDIDPLEHIKALPENVQRRLRTVDLEESTIPGQHGTARRQRMRFKTVDPQRAVETLAKALGIFASAETQQHSINHADLIERGVARLHKLGTLDTTLLYDEDGNFLDD